MYCASESCWLVKNSAQSSRELALEQSAEES